jgi:hypothetical protein
VSLSDPTQGETFLQAHAILCLVAARQSTSCLEEATDKDYFLAFFAVFALVCLAVLLGLLPPASCLFPQGSFLRGGDLSLLPPFALCPAPCVCPISRWSWTAWAPELVIRRDLPESISWLGAFQSRTSTVKQNTLVYTASHPSQYHRGAVQDGGTIKARGGKVQAKKK